MLCRLGVINKQFSLSLLARTSAMCKCLARSQEISNGEESFCMEALLPERDSLTRCELQETLFYFSGETSSIMLLLSDFGLTLPTCSIYLMKLPWKLSKTLHKLKRSKR